MKTIEYTNPTVSREGWPSGEWDSEPDKIQWRDETTGLPCLIVRNRLGGLCGYVGVSRGHRFYEVDYDSVSIGGDSDSYDEAHYPPVHGGLTFSNRCADGPEDTTICHVVEPGEDDDVWWLGFDCGHFMDLMPGMLMTDIRLGANAYLPDTTYKNVSYVRANVEELARWLKEHE